MVDNPSQLIVNGVPTYVHREGDGPPLVMLHGMAATSDCWQRNVEAFHSRYRVIVPDLPGHGRSGGRSRPYNLRFYVDWLDDLLAQSGSAEPAVLMGNSMGGAISLAYAMAHPQRAGKLVLVDPLGLSDSLPWPAVANGLRALPNMLMAVLTRKADPYLMRAVSPWIFRDPWGSSYEAITQMAALNFRQGFWSVGAGLRVVLSDFFSPRQRREFLDRVAGLSQPTLVIWGRHDGMLPLNRATSGLSRLPQAAVEIFEQSAHSAMLEQSEKFNALVNQFLNVAPEA